MVVLVTGGITDLLYSKIYNWLTFPAALAGFIVNAAAGGVQGFLLSLIGFLIGFVVFLLIKIFGGLGGGDVKLMGAVGAIMGYPFILWAMFFTSLAGGFIAVVSMLYHRELIRGLKNVLRTAFTFITPFLKTVPLNPAESRAVPYGFAISVGTLWCWVMHIYEII